MITRISLALALLLSTPSALSQTIQIVPVETGTEADDHVFVFDLILNWNSGTDGVWTGTEVGLSTESGAFLRYHFQDLQDSNGNPIDSSNAGPGIANPFNTFVSIPRPPNAPSRFNDDYSAFIGGSAYPPSITPIRESTRFSVASFSTGGIADDGRDRAVCRFAMDLSPTTSASLPFGDVYFINSGDPNAAPSSGESHVRVGKLPSNHYFRNDGGSGRVFYFRGAFFAVPEPSGFFLLSIGLMSVRRR